MAQKARDTRVIPLAKGLSGSAFAARFSVEGAKGVTIILRAATGTPTIDIGYYAFDSARSGSPADYGLSETLAGTLASGGRVAYIAPDPTASFFIHGSCPLGVTEMDVTLSGAFTGLNAVAILAW